jgi:hypothetical protein
MVPRTRAEHAKVSMAAVLGVSVNVVIWVRLVEKLGYGEWGSGR